jgi:hypothetical protein
MKDFKRMEIANFNATESEGEVKQTHTTYALIF